MPYHLRQTQNVPAETVVGAASSLTTTREIIFGGRGVNGLPARTATPPTYGHRYRSRALVNGKRSTQLLASHLKKRTFTGTVDPQDDEQYAALELLAEMSDREEPLRLVFIAFADPSRITARGDWFVEALQVVKNLGVGGEMDTITYKLSLVEAETE